MSSCRNDPSIRHIRYRAIRPHRSDSLEPIAFSQGTLLQIGQPYTGPEDWPNWLWCRVGDVGGWVPAQIIERLDAHSGIARADYSAQELDVEVGEQLLGQRLLNGWAWCVRAAKDEAGWVPLQCLQAVVD